MKIKCGNCGNIATLENGVCSACEVKASYVILEKSEPKKKSKKKDK